MMFYIFTIRGKNKTNSQLNKTTLYANYYL